ncbi:four helix bundle protein [Catenovulum sediminis]|uniref:Four helix bundle protein n=1 Tax=Catenovulum sediminis TaxID=1740262 RepID=A0ABV1RK02_9ALTE|nr:four helix bundle protein [Catenovulum sediminis]
MYYEKLAIWQRSKALTIDVYSTLSNLRDYGFKDQITRSILSVPSNIAEGMERYSDIDKARFLVIAKASIGEFKTQTDIGVEIGYIPLQTGTVWMNEAEQISKMIGSFIHTLKSN